MIYPTRRAISLMALGALFALIVAALAASHWYLAIAWPLAIALLIGCDAWQTRGLVTIHATLPPSAWVGEVRDLPVTVRIACQPANAEVSLASSPLVDVPHDGRLNFPVMQGIGTAHLPMTMVRRGHASFDRLWLRWQGPLGMAWRQCQEARTDVFPIIPDLRPTERHGIRLFERFAAEGALRQLVRGEGSDFDALVDFRVGMDRRSIDWKSSARATKLLARNYHGEKNNQIIFALDCGRQMSEPVGGVPRLDRVISATLLTSWLALRLGDRVAIDAFDSKPRVVSGFVSGGRAFAEIQRLTASIDYGTDEPNYTYALTDLNGRLSRRSLVILFTELPDLTSARFLIKAVRLLARTHLLLIVLLRDEELEAFAFREPASAQDVTRAITAASLLKERQVVVAELRQLGVDLVEAQHEQVPMQIAEAYLQIKRRDRL